MFKWANPVQQPKVCRKVAAVSPRTHMIEHIYNSISDASFFALGKYDKNFVTEIGKAINNYHYLVNGYWWKYI